MTIGESIRYHRKRLHLTQAQLAQRLNVTMQAVSKWENDTGLPDISMTVPLAEALGTTTDEILRFGQHRREWEKRWNETLHSYGDNPEQLLKLSLNALREFPYDWQFLYRAAVDELRLAEVEGDAQRQTELLGAAAVHAQLSIEMDPEKGSAQWVLNKARTLLKNKTE